MIRAIMSVLFSGWFLSLIGAIVLSLLVWFVGPLIAIAEARPLDADWVRMVVILVILVQIMRIPRISIGNLQTQFSLLPI